MGSKIKPLVSAQYNSIKNEIDAAIRRVFDSGEFIGGSEVEKFEKEIAKHLKVNYAVAVNSGTDALCLSLKALGIGEGDEVITTPFTFIATAEAIISTGARPVFVDIDKDTLNINPELIEGLINKKTKAILPVHIFGNPADMRRIMSIAKSRKLFVVEDAAQAIGAKAIGFKNKMIGGIGDIGALSFFPSKNLGGYGDGGMVLTNSKKLADKVRLLRNHGSSSKEKYRNLIVGANSRLDALQAAILRVKLKHLNEWNKKRVQIAKIYNEGFKSETRMEFPKIYFGHVFNQYTIKTKSRSQFKDYLAKFGVDTKIYYPLPLHLQPALKFLGYKKGDFKETEAASKIVLSLPIFPELKKDEQRCVISAVKSFK